MRFGSLTKLIALGAVVAMVSGAAFAMMASNTVPATNAGQGANTISGYTVTNVHYVLSSDGTHIYEIDFNLLADEPGSTDAASAIANLYDGDGNLTGDTYDCVLTGSNPQAAVCRTEGTQASTLDAVQLSVTAAQ